VSTWVARGTAEPTNRPHPLWLIDRCLLPGNRPSWQYRANFLVPRIWRAATISCRHFTPCTNDCSITARILPFVAYFTSILLTFTRERSSYRREIRATLCQLKCLLSYIRKVFNKSLTSCSRGTRLSTPEIKSSQRWCLCNNAHVVWGHTYLNV